MSIKEAFERTSHQKPTEVTEPELDDFVRETPISAYRNLYESGALESMNDLRKVINVRYTKLPKDLWRIGTRQGSAGWGRASHLEAYNLDPKNLMSFPNGRPKIWEKEVYALPNGLCEVALEWDQVVGYGFGGDTIFRVSILSHPVSGNLLIKGYAQVLLHKSQLLGEEGKESLENALAYVSTRPERISKMIPNPRFSR